MAVTSPAARYDAGIVYTSKYQQNAEHDVEVKISPHIVRLAHRPRSRHDGIVETLDT